MGKRIGLAIGLVALVATVVAAPALGAPRPLKVTRGLDYLHARQDTGGGFGDASATTWAILGAVATGERMGSSAWTVGGENPVAYLQGRNPVTDAAAASNPPVYYAQLIMAYVAAGREDLAYNAGTSGTDLFAKLSSYQDVERDSPTQWSFSPSETNREIEAVRTTSWAILALEALSKSSQGDQFKGAVSWLLAQGNTDGGFPVQPGWDSNADDTAMAVQALIAGRTADNSDAVSAAVSDGVTAPNSYLHDVQMNDGGFRGPDGTRTDGQSTAFAIMAIDAAGQDPSSGAWSTGGNTPTEALKGLQISTGAFARTRGVLIRPVQVTGQALVALSGINLARYPATRPPARTAFPFKPKFVSVSPKNNAKFTGTHIVLIRATYKDGTGGTGIKTSAVRLYVDGVDRTRPADVGAYGLHLQLKNVANGTHTFKIVLGDRAGNGKTLERRFTVAVASPTPSPSPTPTYRPPVVVYPTNTARPTYSPTPSTTLYPSPIPSASASPSPSASGAPVVGTPVMSPSPSPSAGAGSGGGGSAAGYVGGTLLAMLPVGAGIAYYLLRRREDVLATAEEGQMLPGGGSAWDRLKRALSRSKDIIKPAGS